MPKRGTLVVLLHHRKRRGVDHRGGPPLGKIERRPTVKKDAELAAFGTEPKPFFASEDVGNADPRALSVALDVAQAVERIGLPEGRIPLAQAVTWLATCPKSNASYLAINAALADVKRHGPLPVPLHLRNAPTREMKAEGYGEGYQYPHDAPDRIVRQQYLPDALAERQYYKPAPHGAEKTILERMAWWAKRLEERD